MIGSSKTANVSAVMMNPSGKPMNAKTKKRGGEKFNSEDPQLLRL